MYHRRKGGKQFLAVSLLLRLAGASGSYDRCDSYCPQYPTEEALRRFRDAIDNTYAGQEDAVAAISKVLTHNIVANSADASGGGGATLASRPLLMHFTGPTGVGKTLMSSLIQDSLFLTNCGVKKIQLEIDSKLTSKAGQRERTDDMKRKVVQHLERCPRSLIIFDDFQFAPEMMILALRDAFDRTRGEYSETLSYRNQRVSTSNAIFVFCSDLESEQRHLSVEMTMAEARKKVSELAGEQWKNVDQSTAFGKLFASTGMIPFVPLSDSELRKVVRIEMSKLTPRVERYLQFNANNRTVAYNWLGKVRWNEKRLDPAILALLGEDIQNYNARAIRNLVERTLLVHATDISRCLLRDSTRLSKKGWFYGSTIFLVDDINIDDVDSGQHFTVKIADSVCIGKMSATSSIQGWEF